MADPFVTVERRPDGVGQIVAGAAELAAPFAAPGHGQATFVGR
jgi:hypothetical protein